MSGSIYLWALTVKVPEEAVPEIMALLPEGEVSQSCFKEGHSPQADLWIIETHYRVKPEIAQLSLPLGVLAASRNETPYEIGLSEIPAKGWLKANQESFAPIQAGRFVIHGQKDKAKIPSHAHAIQMETSAAFGTGEHPTTYGCLMMIQKIRPLRRHQSAVDVGTGTGVLAIALAQRGQPRICAGDMDAESVAVAIDHVKRNTQRSVIRVVKAEGFKNRAIANSKPYDLVISNIFARPLARLAPAMRVHLKAGGRVILAGFLHKDVPLVLRAYAAQRIYLKRRSVYGNWSILLLERPNRSKTT